ncbi:MAG: D-lyxose/D-mannose family sugar isomerase [Clostridiales bacterium]|nr:D-lyxose/D-mannose family sugar isomerase [Clostridiales bacterium]
MKRSTYREVREKALALYRRAGIVLTAAEQEGLEVADLGLGDVYRTGLSIVTYVNTDLCCAKEMALLPGQTCPEHAHAPLPGIGYIGKEETFRCRYGTVYLYVEGEPAESPAATPPDEYYTVFHEIVLTPGRQHTLRPNTWHWFQAGPEGAVISEFSTASHDEHDIFTNPHIARLQAIEEDEP